MHCYFIISSATINRYLLPNNIFIFISSPEGKIVAMSISEKLGDKKPIFKDRNVLLSAHDPISLENVVHRDEQIDYYQNHLKYALEGFVPDNLFIYGKSGTGKTMLTRLVLEDLLIVAKDLGVNLAVININCENDFTENAVWQSVNDKMPIPDYHTRRKIGNSCPKHTTYFQDLLNMYDGILIIVFDEIDKAVSSFSSVDFINKIVRMKSAKSGFSPSVICITNDLQFASNLKPHVKSVLLQSEMVIPPYNASQLQDILKIRAAAAFAPNALNEVVIPLCAAIGAQESGDARRTIGLLRIAGDQANNRDTDRVVTEDDVRNARTIQEKDCFFEGVRTLPLQSKLVLLAAIFVSKMDGKETTTKEVYATYCTFCRHIGMDILTYRRVADLLSELDMLRILSSHVVSRGQHGRYKVISIPRITALLELRIYDDPRLFPISELKVRKLRKDALTI
jgi:cell division control protein 6